MLEGTKAARRTHFVLPAEDWVGKGLKAHAELRRADQPLSSEVEESYQRHLASMVRRLILALQETLDLAPLPPDTSGTRDQLAELDLLIRNAKEVAGRLPKTPRYEADRLATRARSINQRPRGMSLREHIARLDRAIRATAQELPGASVTVQEWMNVRRQLDDQGFTEPNDDNPGTRIEDFIDALASSALPQTPAALLTWTQRAPAQDLALAHAALDQSEKTVSALLDYVEDYLQEQPGGDPSLDTFHRFGQRIQNTANAIRQALED
jgi:hypothetical protein